MYMRGRNTFALLPVDHFHPDAQLSRVNRSMRPNLSRGGES